ncbi:hypothetical protein WMW72_28165 [Paenibacillus filicis]|uniref:Uncharacterized protein n=1 Tax=Paenibacillus filicis TaxID=669464 RepID=A0ABU9DUN1_9BACL
MSGLIIFIIVLAVVWLVRVMVSSNSARSARRVNPPAPPVYADTPLPDMLGLQAHIPLQSAVRRLEGALSGPYEAKIKERVQAHQPAMSDAEFKWKLLELKRYFLMTAVLRDVPMFSEAVDDIWHEMLMFTREYHQFGETFVGSTIHHAPHTGEASGPDPGGRAWFDWVYAQMFVPTPYSARIWGPFFRHPISTGMLEELRSATQSEVIDRRFNRAAASEDEDIHLAVRSLSQKAMEQAEDANPGATYQADKPAAGSPDYMPYLAGALMVYSAAELMDFDGLMKQHFMQEESKLQAMSSSSSCGSACGATFWEDSRHDSDGHGDGGGSGCSSSDGSSSDGSSSSCSSGSSCSSCGGGGD